MAKDLKAYQYRNKAIAGNSPIFVSEAPVQTRIEFDENGEATEVADAVANVILAQYARFVEDITEN